MKKAVHKPRRISRREFARGSALAAASAACLPGALAQESSVQMPLPGPALSAEGQTEVDIKVSAILRQYGTLLSNEQKLDVRRLLTDRQKPLDAMREFITENWDQPADVLKLYPEVSAQPRAPESRRK